MKMLNTTRGIKKAGEKAPATTSRKLTPHGVVLGMFTRHPETYKALYNIIMYLQALTGAVFNGLSQYGTAAHHIE